MPFKNFFFQWQESCLPEGSSCPESYFDNTRSSPLSSLGSLICQSCASECDSCDGPFNTNCQSCNTAFTTSSGGGGSGAIVQCLSSCSGASNCQNCHTQCVGCTGPSNQQCVTCRENSTLIDGTTTCIPECSRNQYLARVSTTGTEHECRACDAQCMECDGPGNTDCVECLGVSSNENGVTTCLERCPEGTFASSARVCLPTCPTGMIYDGGSGSCQLSL